VFGLTTVTAGIGLVGAGLAPIAPWSLSAPAAARAAPPMRSAEQVRAFERSSLAATDDASVGVADPMRVVIPAIGVDAAVVPLDLWPDGTLKVPADFSWTGWYTGGPEPGEPGAAVIIGHVDSADGPAVFFHLRKLAPNNEIIVQTIDGDSFTFVVEGVEQYPKSTFPTTAVYGPTNERALRLITCGGTFDRAARSYRDNLVVFARLAA
jgi:sortase family protein